MDGYIVIGTEIDTKNFDAQIDYIQNKMEDIEYKLKQADMGFEVGDTSKLEAEYEKLGNQLLSLKQKQNDVINADWSKATIETGKTNVNLSSMVRKLSLIGLAVFGIRTAYTGVRQIMNGVLSQNEGLQKQMDNIRNSLYNAFAPAVEKIISLIKTLMTYINYVWSRLFGKNLFKNVESSSKQTSKNLSSGAKAAKEINKQLAGFDEANVLSANNTSTGGTGSVEVGSGDTTPSFKLAGEVPDWLKKIMDWVEEHPKLSKIIFGIAAFTMFGLFKKNSKITDWISKLLGKKGPANGGGGSGLLGLASTLAWLAGIATIAVEVVVLWRVGKQVHDNFIGLISSKFNETAVLSQAYEYQQQYNQGMADMAQLTSNAEDATQSHIATLIDEIKYQKGSRNSLKLSKTQLEETIVAYSQMYRTGRMTEEQEKNYAEFIKNNLVDAFGVGAAGAQTMADDLKSLDKKYQTDYTLQVKQEGISKIQDAFQKLKDKLSNFFGNSALSNFFGKLSGDIGNAFSNVKSKFKTIFHREGGIVSLPGRGVPVEHRIGEYGREGMIPMDNRSQMAILGQEIAKYVTINNYVTNNIDSRKLNTILQQSASRERLANNG